MVYHTSIRHIIYLCLKAIQNLKSFPSILPKSCGKLESIQRVVYIRQNKLSFTRKSAASSITHRNMEVSQVIVILNFRSYRLLLWNKNCTGFFTVTENNPLNVGKFVRGNRRMNVYSFIRRVHLDRLLYFLSFSYVRSSISWRLNELYWIVCSNIVFVDDN